MTSDPTDTPPEPPTTPQQPASQPPDGSEAAAAAPFLSPVPSPSPRPSLLQPRENAVAATPAPAAADEAPRARRAPLSGEVIPPGIRRPPRQPTYDTPSDFMRNPYVLAGLAVVGAIVLAIAVVFVFGGQPSGAGFDPNRPTQAAGGQTPLPEGGLSVRSIASASVREGPSIEYLEIGVLRSNQDVMVAGRNADASWFQIVYPRNSQLRGWVPASALRVPEAAIAGLQVAAATPIARPTVVIPTAPPQPTSTPTPDATATPTPSPAGPDIAVSVQNASCVAGQPLVLSLRNATGEPIAARGVQIVVATPSEVLGTANTVVDLPAGATTTLSTGIAIRAPRTTATVDLVGQPADPNRANNTVDCVVQAPPQPTAPPAVTPTPPVAATPTTQPGVNVPPPLASPTPVR